MNTAAITLLLGLIDRAAAVGAVINQARAEGRDVNEAELAQAFADDDAARERLKDAIAKARANQP